MTEDIMERSVESVTHPGGSLSDFIEEKGMTVSDFAKEIGVSSSLIEAIVNEEESASITEEIAQGIENAFDSPASFWLRYQSMYNKYITKEKEWLGKFPSLKELVRRNYLPGKGTKALHEFFDTYNYKDWEEHIASGQEASSHISPTIRKDKYAIYAWLRLGEIEAKRLEPKVASAFSCEKFKEALYKAKDLMSRHPEDVLCQLQRFCAKSGAYLVYIPVLKGAPATGATTWLEDRPLIQLSLKGKWSDIFWFTFFHEAGHVMLHKSKRTFISFENVTESDDGKEKEANKFAEEWILKESQLREALDLWAGKNNKQDGIRRLAEKFNTHPGVIAGRLLRKLKDYNKWPRSLNPLREKFEFAKFEERGSCILI